MKTLALVSVLALTTISATGCAECGYALELDAERHETSANVRVPHEPSKPLELRTHNGSIEIKKSGGSEVVVEARLYSKSKERLDEARVHAERVDGTLKIFTTWPGGKPKSDEGATFTVSLPDASRLHLDSSNGKIVSDLPCDSASVDTSNGKIELSGVRGKIHADTSNGAVVLREVSEATVDTSNGSVTIDLADDAKGPVSADTSNGQITLTVGAAFAGRVHASTSNGTINNNTGRGTQTGKKAKGTITFGDGPECTLESSNGSITVKGK